MNGPGAQNPALYRILEDILQRQAEITAVRYEPDAIQRRYLAATVGPSRVVSPTGPDTPGLEVHWQTTPPHDVFRIDYHDPNTAFRCGWHRDDDHDDLGPTHFQCQAADMDDPAYEEARFGVDAPARILWECCDRLFSTVLPERNE